MGDLKFSPGCCCGCAVFDDSFDDREENLEDDDVNAIGSTRYVFTAGDWHVDTGSGRLVCDTTGSLLKFYDDATAKIYNVSVWVYGLENVGDYGEITAGGEASRVEVTGADELTYSFAGQTSVVDSITFPTDVQIFLKLFSADEHTEDFACIEGADSDIGIFRSFDTCLDAHLDIGDGYTSYGLRATEGIEFDTLVVTKATNECEALDIDCRNVCWERPESITVSIEGVQSDYSWCGPINPGESECGEERDDCLVLCGGPGDPGYQTCVCDCLQVYSGCLCDAVTGAGECIEHCPGTSLNGEWVCESEDCSCSYLAERTIYGRVDTVDEFGEYHCELSDEQTASCGCEIIYRGCDETGPLVEVQFGPPFANPVITYWSTGIIPASDLCGGGSLELIPYAGFPTPGPDPGLVLHADEVLFGCGFGTDHSFRCGYDSTYFDEFDVEHVCSSGADVPCDFAQHDPVTVGPAVVA
jgi:hypothetical protein